MNERTVVSCGTIVVTVITAVAMLNSPTTTDIADFWDDSTASEISFTQTITENGVTSTFCTMSLGKAPVFSGSTQTGFDLTVKYDAQVASQLLKLKVIEVDASGAAVTRGEVSEAAGDFSPTDTTAVVTGTIGLDRQEIIIQVTYDSGHVRNVWTSET